MCYYKCIVKNAHKEDGMVFRCLSFGIDGIDGFKVEVEASSKMGLPQIGIMGLGTSLFTDAMRVPFPPAIITTFIYYSPKK